MMKRFIHHLMGGSLAASEATVQSPSRRRLLQQIAAGGAATALWPLMRPALADTASPRRVIFVYIPNGVKYSSWHPSGGESDFTLPTMTAPLERVREHCLFLQGVNMYGSAGTHEGGQHKALSGRSGQANDAGPTLDWYLGQQFKLSVSRPFLNLGIIGNQWSKPITFDGDGKALTTEDNPLSVYERLFGSDAAADAILARRRSLIDRSLAEVNSLSQQLGSTEREKLDVHLESLRAIERTLGDAAAGECNTAGFNPTGFTITGREHLDHANVPVVGDLQTDLAVKALACDLTRVVTLKWAYPVTPVIIPESGSNSPCHQASHAQDRNFDLIKAWFVDQFANLIEQLALHPDGDGTLLDNTLLWTFSELGDSSGHNHRNMPFVMAGGRAAGIRGGRNLTYSDEAHNKILVSMANFMGVPISEFGYSDSNPGPLSGLT